MRVVCALLLVAAALAANKDGDLKFLTVTATVSKGRDASKGTSATAETPKALKAPVSATEKEWLTLSFPVSTTAGKAARPHQAFVRLTHQETELSTFYVAVPDEDGGAHVATLDLSVEKETLLGRSGLYSVDLIVGDPAFEAGAQWHVGVLDLDLGAAQTEELPLYHQPLLHESDTTLKPLPEIEHQFRVDDARAHDFFSMVFTGIVAVLLVVFVLALMGSSNSNLQGMPGGAGFPLLVAFHGVLGLILALFALYWLRLTMFQTLTYLAPLALAATVIGHQHLRNLAVLSAKSD